MAMISPHCVNDKGWMGESLASGPLVNGQKCFLAIVIQESSVKEETVPLEIRLTASEPHKRA